jgi:hypothetical protein
LAPETEIVHRFDAFSPFHLSGQITFGGVISYGLLDVKFVRRDGKFVFRIKERKNMKKGS